MAKKNKKKSRHQKHKTVKLGNLSSEDLLEKGEFLLGQDKFQDAIPYFKQLLKSDGESNAKALAGLEKAYLGRISALAAKSLIKEAVALLEVMVQRCPGSDVDSIRLGLLLQSGAYSDAALLYSTCHERLTSEQQLRAEALFGALLVSSAHLKESELADHLPVVRFYPQAKKAVELFCSGKEDELQDALRKIPFRSPYRDLRVLLTGLHTLPTDKEKGRELLRRITEKSPYHSTATGYLAAQCTPREFLTNLAQVPASRRQQFRELYGLRIAPFKALEELAKQDISRRHMYQFMSRHLKCFNQQQKRELLKSIIPFCGIDGAEILYSLPDLTMSEKVRLLALAAEQDGATSIAVEFWDDYLSTIDKSDASRHKEIALVLRRQGTLMKREDFHFSPQDILEPMIKSLEYDPGHAQTWLDSADFARCYLSRQRQHAILRDATAQLPKSVPILLAAMKASSERGAHKQAAGLATKVLKIDPINTSALDFLVESRLEHGRKLASQGKWGLAENELQNADTRVKSIRLRGRNQICLGMVLLLQGNEEGLQQIDAGIQENGLPILGRVLPALEARLYDLPAKWCNEFDKDLRQAASTPGNIDEKEFLRLISWISSFSGNYWSSLKEVCQKLKGYFSRSAGLDWGLEEGLLICRGLERVDMHTALAKCAKGLHKKYPSAVEGEVWCILSESLKNNKPLASLTYSRLEDLLVELEDQGKSAFTDYIDKIIDEKCLDTDDMHVDFSSHKHNDIIEFDPFDVFKPPKKQSPKKAEPKTKKAQSTAKQLNLFDDL